MMCCCKQMRAYDWRNSDWGSDVVSSELAAALDLLVEEGAIRSGALGVEVSDLPFERLHELADAVVGLAAAPKAQARWAAPAAAAAAEVVLEVEIGRAHV